MRFSSLSAAKGVNLLFLFIILSKHIRTSPQRRPRQTDRRATQVVGDVLDKRQDIWTETEMVLDDLNSTLEEAISSSQSSIPRPFNSRRRQSLERAKSLAEKGQKVVKRFVK